jgi:hypothetical protein
LLHSIGLVSTFIFASRPRRLNHQKEPQSQSAKDPRLPDPIFNAA